jgi:hypothetical protein
VKSTSSNEPEKENIDQKRNAFETILEENKDSTFNITSFNNKEKEGRVVRVTSPLIEL